jgi:hypothetical protein
MYWYPPSLRDRFICATGAELMKKQMTILALLLAMIVSARSFTPPASVIAADAKITKQAASKSAAEILPTSTLAYVEITEPKKLVSLLLDHPAHDKLKGTDQYKAFLKSKPFRRLKFGLEYFELETELKWRETLEAVAGGGIYVAVDGQTQGAALLIKTTDINKLNDLRDKLLAWAQDNDKKIPASAYRGVATYKVGVGGLAIVGPWLVASNNGDLGKTLIDNLIDDNAGSTLAGDKVFQSASKQAKQTAGKSTAKATSPGKSFDTSAPTMWAFARVSAFRQAGQLDELLNDANNNPAGELLIGGLRDVIKRAPFATAALTLNEDRVQFTVAAPHDGSEVSKARSYFFSKSDQGAAPKPLNPKGLAASVVLYRDIAGMFRHADSLFNENIAAKIAQSETQLSLFFGGRSLTNDVLASFSPRMQLIVTRQEYSEVTPTIKLPAGALVFQSKKDDKLTRQQLRSAFNSMVGIGNIAGTQQGKPMLMLDIAKHSGADILSASYVVDPESTDKKNADIVYNASPALAVFENYVVLSSTKQLATKLVDEIKKQGDKVVGQNTLIQLDGAMINQMLGDNREFIIGQSMLNKGHDRETAVAEVDMLLKLSKYIKAAQISLDFRDKVARFDVGVDLNLK